MKKIIVLMMVLVVDCAIFAQVDPMAKEPVINMPSSEVVINNVEVNAPGIDAATTYDNETPWFNSVFGSFLLNRKLTAGKVSATVTPNQIWGGNVTPISSKLASISGGLRLFADAKSATNMSFTSSNAGGPVASFTTNADGGLSLGGLGGGIPEPGDDDQPIGVEASIGNGLLILCLLLLAYVVVFAIKRKSFLEAEDGEATLS